MKTFRYLLLVAAFATILLTSYSVLMALQSEPGDGSNQGSVGYGVWVYYGDVRHEVWCTTIESYFDWTSLSWQTRVINRQGYDYWALYICQGSGKECTIGTQQERYKSGGC